jgi:hypothetical protein
MMNIQGKIKMEERGFCLVWNCYNNKSISTYALIWTYKCSSHPTQSADYFPIPTISMKTRLCKAREYWKPIKSPQFVLLAHLVIIATCADLSYKSKVPTQFGAI